MINLLFELGMSKVFWDYLRALKLASTLCLYDYLFVPSGKTISGASLVYTELQIKLPLCSTGTPYFYKNFAFAFSICYSLFWPASSNPAVLSLNYCLNYLSMTVTPGPSAAITTGSGWETALMGLANLTLRAVF